MSLEKKVKQLEFELEQEKTRAAQLSTNCLWLIDKLDLIHMHLNLVPTGGWQDRAEQCVEAAKALSEDNIG